VAGVQTQVDVADLQEALGLLRRLEVRAEVGVERRLQPAIATAGASLGDMAGEQPPALGVEPDRG
jgi:hypothetical protein